MKKLIATATLLFTLSLYVDHDRRDQRKCDERVDERFMCARRQG